MPSSFLETLRVVNAPDVLLFLPFWSPRLRVLSGPLVAGWRSIEWRLWLLFGHSALRVTYWSRVDDARSGSSIRGCTSGLRQAMRACEVDHGGSLAWEEVEPLHDTARAGAMVYTVRYEHSPTDPGTPVGLMPILA